MLNDSRRLDQYDKPKTDKKREYDGKIGLYVNNDFASNVRSLKPRLSSSYWIMGSSNIYFPAFYHWGRIVFKCSFAVTLASLGFNRNLD